MDSISYFCNAIRTTTHAIASTSKFVHHLALFWKKEMRLEIQNYSRRHINAVVKSPDTKKQGKLIGFYGHLESAKRKES